jgi:hypothetical protein
LSPGRVKNFVLLYVVQTGSGAHPASYPSIPGAFSMRVKSSVREADHSPPTSTEVKENMDLHIHSLIRLHGVVLN